MESKIENQNKSQNKSYKIFLAAFFIILALPLFTSSPWFSPAPWGKVVVFRIIVAILIFLFLKQILSNKVDEKILLTAKSLLSKKNKLFWPFWLLIALWGVFLLATIFSLDPLYSFWESPFRAGGFLNYSFYIIFAILAFLFIRKKIWLKIWDFNFIIAALASIIAILQYFHVFKKYLVSYTERPPSTFGNSIFLGIYLLLLLFLALSFGTKEKKRFKKIFYLSISLLFIIVLLITESRALYIGTIIGFLYFFLFYPSKIKSRKLLLAKVITVIAVFLAIFGVYYINTNPLPRFVENSPKIRMITHRLSFDLIAEESRFSTWQIALEAIKERPVLGYGPENFSIAFDKYYDPQLPGLFSIWWDRAHNFLLDITLEAGIPALIIYVSLFSVLFWHLQKIKKKNHNDALACHAIQTSFIAYLATSFFSFDSFSTYLIFFLLVGYSLFLIQKNSIIYVEEKDEKEKQDRLWKSAAIFGLFCVLVLFIWFAALKPLGINKEINWADYYVHTGQCDKAVEKMEKDVLMSKSIIDSYAKFKYIEVLKKCTQGNLELKLSSAPKAISVLKKLTRLRPYYTRTYLFLGSYTNLLIENSSYLKIENVKELEKESDSFFQKAHELSPKREEVFIGWIQTNFLSKNYRKAKEKAEECSKLAPVFAYCPWLRALSNIYSHDFEQADKDIAESIQKGHDHDSTKSLLQLHKAYTTALESSPNKEFDMKCYERLADVYKNLTLYADPNNVQYYISLAEIYKILGEYKKAREQAIFIVRYSKESQENVKNFLDLIFSLDNNSFEHHIALAFFYRELNEIEKSKEQALIAQKLVPPYLLIPGNKKYFYNIWRHFDLPDIHY